MAAVIGRVFDFRILERLARTDRLDEQVSVLQRAALVEVHGGEGAFRHVLIQDAAYDSILIKQRPELHRRAGEALEELQIERKEEFAALLAQIPIYMVLNEEAPLLGAMSQASRAAKLGKALQSPA